MFKLLRTARDRVPHQHRTLPLSTIHFIRGHNHDLPPWIGPCTRKQSLELFGIPKRPRPSASHYANKGPCETIDTIDSVEKLMMDRLDNLETSLKAMQERQFALTKQQRVPLSPETVNLNKQIILMIQQTILMVQQTTLMRQQAELAKKPVEVVEQQDDPPRQVERSSCQNCEGSSCQKRWPLKTRDGFPIHVADWLVRGRR